MSVTVELQNIADPRVPGNEILALIEHVLRDEPGSWRVTILGSRAPDNWEMRVEGPKGFERLYTLQGNSREHEPQVIGCVLSKLVPTTRGSPVDGQELSIAVPKYL